MPETVSILEGETFVVSDRAGNVEGSPTNPHGLFHYDTRFLSRWVLTVNGQKPSPLSIDDLDYFAAQFFLVPSTGTIYVDSPLSIIRTRKVGDGFHEDLKIQNHSDKPMELNVRIEADSDFADLFEVKDALKKKGQHYTRVEKDKLVLGYKRDKFVRETWVHANNGAQIDSKSVNFSVSLPPRGEWSECLDVITAVDGYLNRTDVKYRHGELKGRPNMGSSLEEWVSQAPVLNATWKPLEEIYRRSQVDLAALRFFPPLVPGRAIPAAGLPWFMAMFGRDSLITSFQSLQFAPELAETALKVLAARQGTHLDDFRDEEPGKILHEVRWGEMTAFEERPHSPYFGTADATPLFLILLDEYERWFGDGQLVRSLKKQGLAALRWMDEFGDRDGDGYIEYDRKNKETGLENQCWKDSWNSILFSDGTLAPRPLATCEIQGYAYDAKVRSARMAREFWDEPELANKLEAQAKELRRKFNEDFWIKDRKFFALALDGKKRKVDALTSNIGHLLWSGIVDADKAAACAKHLLSPELFSGWGIRTMATSEQGYNPIGYHVGTVWPHDNSIIAWGLRRYGFRDEAAKVCLGILEAATYFHYRLPEAFAGYPREMTHFPVEYPTACSPQAWATAAPFLLIRSLLGLDPVGDRLLVDPAIPKQIAEIELLGIPGRWGRSDAFGRGVIDVKNEALPRLDD